MNVTRTCHTMWYHVTPDDTKMMPCDSMLYHWILCDIIAHIIHCSTAPSQGQLPGPPASPCSQGCPRPPVPPAPQYWDLSAGQSAHPVGVWGMKVIKKVRGILTVLSNTVTVVIKATYTEDIPRGYTTQVYRVMQDTMYTPWLYNPSIQSYARYMYTPLAIQPKYIYRIMHWLPRYIPCYPSQVYWSWSIWKYTVIFFSFCSSGSIELMTDDITWCWYSLHIPSPSLQWQRNWWTGRRWNTPCWCWWCRTSCLASQSAHMWWV